MSSPSSDDEITPAGPTTPLPPAPPPQQPSPPQVPGVPQPHVPAQMSPDVDWHLYLPPTWEHPAHTHAHAAASHPPANPSVSLAENQGAPSHAVHPTTSGVSTNEGAPPPANGGAPPPANEGASPPGEHPPTAAPSAGQVAPPRAAGGDSSVNLPRDDDDTPTPIPHVVPGGAVSWLFPAHGNIHARTDHPPVGRDEAQGDSIALNAPDVARTNLPSPVASPAGNSTGEDPIVVDLTQDSE